MIDKFNPGRFIYKQDFVYENVVRELKNGQKNSHWMWFIFPQIEGLGRSSIAKEFSIKSMAEARAYLDHPVLGERLKQCTQLVLDIDGKTAIDIFGHPDYLKFRSCMSLYSAVEEKGNIFEMALSKYFNGIPDERTLSIIKEM